VLLEKLIEDNEIFTFIKPLGKKSTSNNTKSIGKQAPADDNIIVDSETRRVTRGQMGKSFSRGAKIKEDESEDDD